MEYSFFDTVGGHRFVNGTIPRLIDAIESLSKNIESLNTSNTEENTPLMQFCLREAEFRLKDRKVIFSDENIKALAQELYEASESWIDSETIDDITGDFISKEGSLL